MDDFLITVHGQDGYPTFQILVQVPHSKHAKDMSEALCFFGLRALLGGNVKQYHITQIEKQMRRAHFIITVRGLEVGGQLVNDFFIYVQLPRGNNARLAVESMVTSGLAFGLGHAVKKIECQPLAETNPGAGDTQRILTS